MLEALWSAVERTRGHVRSLTRSRLGDLPYLRFTEISIVESRRGAWQHVCDFETALARVQARRPGAQQIFEGDRVLRAIAMPL